jgi:RimJ/RimL family protein N-acetyltransferase
VETQRLQMRWLTLDDAELMLAIWNDPAFIRHVGDKGIRTIDEARKALNEGVMQIYAKHGYGPYRVALKSDDTPIGICGLFRRDGLDEPDIGFGLLPDYCRNGYAYEASCAAIEHARSKLEIPRLTAIVSPENVVSISLIEKLGLQFERMTRLPGDDCDICLYAMQLND